MPKTDIFISDMTEVKRQKDQTRYSGNYRLVPPAGNLVQGQSELAIDPELAKEAYEIIAASQNHYGSSEGVRPFRKAVAEKIKTYNNIAVDVEAKKPELLVTPGGTGALVRHRAELSERQIRTRF